MREVALDTMGEREVASASWERERGCISFMGEREVASDTMGERLHQIPLER